jgi:hypothetical protein
MAITMNWYPAAFDNMFKGRIKEGNTFKIALLTSSGLFNSAHDEWADISPTEAVGTNYAQRTVVITSALDAPLSGGPTKTEFTVPSASWPNLTCTFQNAVIYDDTSTGDKLLLHLAYSDPMTITASDYQLNAADPKPAIDPA